MASLAFELALLALFYSSKTETHGQIITVKAELHTTVDLPCRCPIFPETAALVQWYRSSNSDVYLKDGTSLASWSVGTSRSLQGFGITDDFSMVIYNLTVQHDQELYRCIVSPLGGGAECTHDVKLGIYANPDTSPVIGYIWQTNGFTVTCSISNVFPMTFPILTTKEGSITAYGTLNRDGTYNTAVTRWLPTNDGDTTIECQYSNLNFKSISSLRIVGSDTIDQPEEEDTMEDGRERETKMNGTAFINSDGTYNTTVTHWFLSNEKDTTIQCLYSNLNFKSSSSLRIIDSDSINQNTTPLRTIRNNTADIDRDKHQGENSEEKEPAKSTRIMLLLSRLML